METDQLDWVACLGEVMDWGRVTGWDGETDLGEGVEIGLGGGEVIDWDVDGVIGLGVESD